MNLRDLLRELDIPFREAGESIHVTHGWLGIECPHCGRGTGKFGMGINLQSLACKCWKCGLGKLSDTIASAARRPVRDIFPLLRQISHLNESWGVSERPAPVRGKYEPPSGVGELSKAHRNYLRGREFDPDYLYEHWGVRGIGHDGGQYRWRLFLPVYRDGREACWQTRAIGRDVEPRYLSSPPERSAVSIKHCLAGEQHAGHAVAVVEGFFQMMRIGDGALATCGVGYTDAQVILLSQYPSRVVCFDNEPEAQRRARALADALSVFPGSTTVVCLSGPQPDSSPLEEIEELRSVYLE